MMACFDRPTLPDPGELCCDGLAARGPDHCTCWDPVYDIEQAPPCPGPAETRTAPCGDCAFRADSPERTGDPRYELSASGDLESLIYGREAFFCHVGMRRIVAWVHPNGMRVECPPGSYAPPCADGQAFKADGSPAEHCAGLAARRRHLEENPDA